MAIGSLEVAIRHLVALSEAKAEEARDQVSAAMDALAGAYLPLRKISDVHLD